MSSCVLDASALLAMLQNETGAEVVRARLDGAWLSAVNLAEVLTKGTERGVPVGQQMQVLQALPVRIIPFDTDLACLTALLRPATRTAGLSLGDRACLALGQQQGFPVLTAEQDWHGLNTGVSVERIRTVGGPAGRKN